MLRGRPDVAAALTRPADLNPEASTGPVEKAYGPIERSWSRAVGGDRHAGKRYMTTYLWPWVWERMAPLRCRTLAVMFAGARAGHVEC